jgi:hypothetical protein
MFFKVETASIFKRMLYLFFPISLFIGAIYFDVEQYQITPGKMQAWYNDSFLEYVKKQPEITYQINKYYLSRYEPEHDKYEIYVKYKEKNKIKIFKGWAEIKKSNIEQFSFKKIDPKSPFDLTKKIYYPVLSIKNMTKNTIPLGKEKKDIFNRENYIPSDSGLYGINAICMITLILSGMMFFFCLFDVYADYKLQREIREVLSEETIGETLIAPENVNTVSEMKNEKKLSKKKRTIRI